MKKYGKLLHGEPVHVSTKQHERILCDAPLHDVRVHKTATTLAFVYGGVHLDSPTATCKAVLPPRNGETNEWAGPRHLYVKRGDVWVNIKTAQTAPFIAEEPRPITIRRVKSEVDELKERVIALEEALRLSNERQIAVAALAALTARDLQALKATSK